MERPNLCEINLLPYTCTLNHPSYGLFSGFLAKVKDKAEDVGQKIQAKAESAGLKPASPSASRKNSSAQQSPSIRPRQLKVCHSV